MFKTILIFLALLAAWVFLTDRGREWMNSKMGVKLGAKTSQVDEPPIPPPPHPAVLQLESRIKEKEDKIQTLKRELAQEQEARSQIRNPAFRTDPMFLENSIRRVEKERDDLERELKILKARLTPPAAQ